MNYFKVVSLILGVYFLGDLLYKAKDVLKCDPTPLGLWGVFRIMFMIVFIWGLGYISGKKDLEQ